MKSKGVFIRVYEDLLEEFIVKSRKKSVTSQMKGLVRSRFSLKELEELYLVSK